MSRTTVVKTASAGWYELVVSYMQLIRFSHTVFALPFALLATAWALVVPLPGKSGTDGTSDETRFLVLQWQSILGIVLCMVTARSFAMAMNRLLDHHWDGQNPRTANRHLPAELLSRRGVLGFSLCCAAGFVGACGLFLPNSLPLILSGPILVFLAGYSLAKRFTVLVHFWLGTALMLAPICAWIALRGDSVVGYPTDLLPAAGIGLVVLLWVSGFDIIYACQDADFDRKAGLFSIPAKLGVRRALWVAALCHLAMWALAISLSFLLPQLSLGWFFRGTLLVVGLLLIYEHSVVSENSLDRMQLAFFQLNSIISVLFLVVGTCDAYWR